MVELFEGIVALADGLPSEQTLLGVILLLAASLARRTLIRISLAFADRVLHFHITFRLKSGSLLVDVRVGGLGLWVWLNTYWRRR